ncbi:hypothetical protein GKS17_00035 [Streptococcus uberis]|uniref:hypothetical protein n=1 Tax=Streptococcus uberis TaxID=1349 RepID=UPI0012B66A25|nr:hypothetical protein [Streptococcus uberis]MCK1160251.1 hypothetical protein [Streptococcus uberis]MTC89695.1 hypothetical protein [Streptococcus uberis]MTC95201.1 hypothetical protein [Streptococcus uberis]
MDIENKLSYLSVNNMLGFFTNKPTGMFPNELCARIYEIGLNFKAEFLDEVYSDGPIFFKMFLTSKDKEDLDDLIIFTSIGNELNPKEENLKHLIYENHLLVKSEDFVTTLPNDLTSYYNALLEKYKKNYNTIEVYHVLYKIDDEVFVDVYSEVE